MVICNLRHSTGSLVPLFVCTITFCVLSSQNSRNMPFHGFQLTASINIITNDIIVKAGTHLLAFGVEKIPFLSNIIFWNSGYVQRMKGKTFCLIFFLKSESVRTYLSEILFHHLPKDQCAGNSFPSPFFKRLRSFQSTCSRV